jgi:competence protein ComEA
MLRALVLLAAAAWLVRGAARGLTPPPALAPPPRPLVVNVASDPPERLALLPGIGPRRAAAILEDRRRHGPITTLQDLERIPGIGPVTVEGIRTAREVRIRLPIRAPPRPPHPRGDRRR